MNNSSLSLLLLLLCLVIQLGQGNVGPANSLEVDGAVGETVTLPLTLPEAINSTIYWHHNGSTIVVFSIKEDRSPQVTSMFSKWKDRLTVNRSNLLLGPLRTTDSGVYHANIDTGNSAKSVTYWLRIFYRLRNLRVAHSVRHLENGTCELQLTCVLPENMENNVRLWWQTSGNIVGTEANITVSWVPLDPPGDEFICTAKNPISNVSSSINASVLCSVASEVVLWVIIQSVVLPVVLLVLLVVLLICYCQKKSLRGIFCISTQQTWCPVAPGGAQEGYRENTPTRCPDQPSGPAAQTPRNIDCAYKSVGNSVYAQITHRKQEMEVTPSKGSESVTIYSTIQPCRGVGPVPGPSGSHPYFLAM